MGLRNTDEEEGWWYSCCSYLEACSALTATHRWQRTQTRTTGRAWSGCCDIESPPRRAPIVQSRLPRRRFLDTVTICLFRFLHGFDGNSQPRLAQELGSASPESSATQSPGAKEPNNAPTCSSPQKTQQRQARPQAR